MSSTDIFVAIADTLHGSKLYFFYFMPKIIRILSKDHVPLKIFSKYPTVNILKLRYTQNLTLLSSFGQL